MYRFKILGMTDSAGHCELCGTFCPRRRVAVQLVDVDGAANGEPQYWGVVCAAEARHGRRDSTLARQLRAEAEEAGEYAGPAAGHRRGPRPTVRRQSRREAARLADLAATDARIVWARTAAEVPPQYRTATGVDAAGYRYRLTGRRAEAGVFMVDAADRLAVVDTSDAADVARFERHGFRPSSWGRLVEWMPTPATA